MTVQRMDKVGILLEDIYRLCCMRGPEGILIGRVQQLGQQNFRENPMDRSR